MADAISKAKKLQRENRRLMALYIVATFFCAVLGVFTASLEGWGQAVWSFIAASIFLLLVIALWVSTRRLDRAIKMFK